MRCSQYFVDLRPEAAIYFSSSELDVCRSNGPGLVNVVIANFQDYPRLLHGVGDLRPIRRFADKAHLVESSRTRSILRVLHLNCGNGTREFHFSRRRRGARVCTGSYSGIPCRKTQNILELFSQQATTQKGFAILPERDRREGMPKTVFAQLRNLTIKEGSKRQRRGDQVLNRRAMKQEIMGSNAEHEARVVCRITRGSQCMNRTCKKNILEPDRVWRSISP